MILFMLYLISLRKEPNMHNSIDIYICHHSENKERIKYLSQSLINTQKNVVDLFHPSSITNSLYPLSESISWWNDYISALNRILNLVNIFHVPQDLFSKIRLVIKLLHENPRRLTEPNLGQRSLTLKHDFAIRKFASSSNLFALILEDDSIVNDEDVISISRFLDVSLKALNNTNPFFIDIGQGARMQLSRFKFLNRLTSNNLYKMKIRSCRTTCAYLINKEFAFKWIKEIDQSCFPSNFSGSDFLMTGFLSRFKISVYWTKEPFVLHGSENGSWKSNFL